MKVVCPECGEQVLEDDAVVVDGVIVCDGCAELFEAEELQMKIEDAIQALREQAYLAEGNFTHSQRKYAKVILGHIAELEEQVNEKHADNVTEVF